VSNGRYRTNKNVCDNRASCRSLTCGSMRPEPGGASRSW